MASSSGLLNSSAINFSNSWISLVGWIISRASDTAIVLHILKDGTSDVNKGGWSASWKEFWDRMWKRWMMEARKGGSSEIWVCCIFCFIHNLTVSHLLSISTALRQLAYLTDLFLSTETPTLLQSTNHGRAFALCNQ